MTHVKGVETTPSRAETPIWPGPRPGNVGAVLDLNDGAAASKFSVGAVLVGAAAQLHLELHKIKF